MSEADTLLAGSFLHIIEVRDIAPKNRVDLENTTSHLFGSLEHDNMQESQE